MKSRSALLIKGPFVKRRDDSNYMFYFAYGSNMNSERLRDRVGSVESGVKSILNGYEIRFDKISKKTNSGRANLILSENTRVEGVVFNLTEKQINDLDKNESGYHRENLKIETEKGGDEAVTYIADTNMIKEGLQPEEEYLALILEGAKEYGLSNSWVIKTYLH